MTMASQKQISANRLNARLSTGPRTSAGRQRSRMNAITHGMTAQDIVVIDENPEDFEQLHRGNIDALQPVGAWESEIVRKLTIEAWKLRRMDRIIPYLFKKESEYVDEAREGVRDAKLLQKLSRKFLLKLVSDEPVEENFEDIDTSVGVGVILGATFVRILKNESGETFEKIQRHQTAIERAIFRWTVLLERAQETRRAREAAKVKLIESPRASVRQDSLSKSD
jgi:hypothetical protein